MVELGKKSEQTVVFQDKRGRNSFSTFRTPLEGERIVRELESQGIHITGTTSLENARGSSENFTPREIFSLAEAKRQ